MFWHNGFILNISAGKLLWKTNRREVIFRRCGIDNGSYICGGQEFLIVTTRTTCGFLIVRYSNVIHIQTSFSGQDIAENFSVKLFTNYNRKKSMEQMGFDINVSSTPKRTDVVWVACFLGDKWNVYFFIHKLLNLTIYSIVGAGCIIWLTCLYIHFFCFFWQNINRFFH